MKIDINGVSTGTIYNVTGGNTGVFTTPINLVSGISYIKFHGDGVNYAPDLGAFTLTTIPVTTTTTPTTTVPTTTVPANSSIRINTTDKGTGLNQINFSGTWNDDVGEVWTQSVNSTFTINFKGVGISLVAVKDPKHGIYEVSIDNGAAIEVNANATTRTQPQTIYNSGVLTDGNHTLQFKIKTTDAQINYAVVNLGSTVTPTTPTTTVPSPTAPATPTYSYNIANGVYSGGASTDAGTNFAGYIGGPTDGGITVGVNVATTTLYNLAIKYIGADTNRPLKIDINGVNTGSIYTPPKTGGWTVNDALTFTVAIMLNSGVNTIKFHGDGANYGPSLGAFTLSTIPTVTPTTPTTTVPTQTLPTAPTIPTYSYNVSKGLLQGGAMLDAVANLATNLGGPSNGNSTVGINVATNTVYNLAVSYRNGNRPMKIDINGVSTGTIYNVTGGNTGVFTTPINLVSG
ncbi:MAG: hypothetical protein ACRC7R_00105, partial [Sarcina sp.]